MKPIAIPRPTDPELRRQWDEAKRAVEQRDFVAELDAMEDSLRQIRQEHRTALTAAELRPIGATADPDCCVGDRSQCRCSPERGGWSDEDVEREKWIAVWAGDE